MKQYYDDGYNGVITSDDEAKKELLREIIYLKAEELMVWKNAVVMQGMDGLELKLMLPKTKRIDPQKIAEGARARYRKVDWFNINEVMEKESVELMITDEANARGLDNVQMRYSMIAAARGLAWSKDTDIKNTIVNGKGGTDAASGLWTDPTTDIASDVADCIGAIIDNSELNEYTLGQLQIFYPAGLFAHLNKLVQIGEIKDTIRDYLGRQYDMVFNPTKQLTQNAYVVVPGEETASHIFYTGQDIKLVESEREMGVGERYLITQLFKTFVMPEEDGGTTNSRIREITNVKA
jgi:hypothetical protein